MKKILFFTIIIAQVNFLGCSQSPAKKKSFSALHVGGSCEGCEAIFESPVPFEKLTWIDTLPDFTEPGPKLVISGVIYNADGKTPASGVVLYVYHTDQTGHYTKKGDEKGWGLRHGYIRGWMKTNDRGEYKFYTLKPAAYPGANISAHIHPVLKEPGKNEYWIDEYLFEDDKFITSENRKKLEQRGGNGIIILHENNGVLYGKRDIVLGLHIPGYTAADTKTPACRPGIQSGLSIGANCPAFDPLHISGADAGKHVCPMCKYGYGAGIMVWIKHTNLSRMDQFVETLEQEMLNRGEKKFRVFVVYMNPSYLQNDETGGKILQQKIKEWCSRQNLRKVAVVWISSPVDESCKKYNINPLAFNTIMAYKQRKIIAKWVNMTYTSESLETILKQF
jgi:protocatechuate 3,4-dioxygenase, beta subunit